MVPPLAFMSLSFSEILVLGLVAILVFGGRLPDVMRNLGRSYAKFRQGMNDLASPLRDELQRKDATWRRPGSPTQPSALPPPASEPPAPLYETGDSTPSEAATEAVEAESAPERVRPPRPSPRSRPRDPGGAADEPPPV